MNKKLKYALSFVLLFAVAAYTKSLIRGTTMSIDQVKKTWGSAKLDYEKFKVGDEKTRSSMAYSILSEKKLIGINVQSLREILGSPNGFYFIDSYPAYFIQIGRNHSEDTWQIVFALNSKYQVEEIFVHKNCCDR